MNKKVLMAFSKIFVLITLIFIMTGCGGIGTERYKKYMKIVENEAKVFDILTNIQEDSVVMNDDGTMTFNAVTEEGVVIPFVARNVVYKDGTFIVSPRGKVDALKSVGQIYGYHALVSDPGSEMNMLEFYGSYTFSEVTEVNSVKKLTPSTRHCKYTSDYDEKNGFVELFDFLPNYIGFCASPIIYEEPEMVYDDFTITSLKVYYNTDTYTTGIKYLTTDESFTTYLEGMKYDASKEGIFDSETGILDFYLIAVPDVYAEDEEVDIDEILSYSNSRTIYGIESETMRVGDLKDASGNVMDKSDTEVQKGMTLDIHFGETTHTLTLPVLSQYKGASTINDLLPNLHPEATGDLNVLVIPINWSDEEATDEKLQMMKEMVGKVSENGMITDYTKDTESLSSYFEEASYGKLNIVSYFTDWYQSEYAFDEMKNNDLSMSGKRAEESKDSRPVSYAEEIISWVNKTQTISKDDLDKDDNGLYDAVLFINAGDMPYEEAYYPLSFGGAYFQSINYTGHGLTDETHLGLNAYISLHTNLGSNTLIHEFGHQLGLVDYYDVSYSGYDAVGGYDMQSTNIGDWNPYSKYAVGWITPTIVKDMAVGEYVDIEIESFAKTGDTIVIPVAGDDFDGPFDEYIIVDLLTGEGLSTFKPENNETVINEDDYGIRIYHVNSVMERRDLKEGDNTYPIGTIHYTNAYNSNGHYLIEMIQSGGKNTFTNMYREIRLFNSSDLFQENDVFTAEQYNEFFLDGKMDDGDEFGYSIKVLDMNKVNDEYKAVIRVTRQ